MTISCNFVFFFKQKTAYEMRISDWSSDVCSSDLPPHPGFHRRGPCRGRSGWTRPPPPSSRCSLPARYCRTDRKSVVLGKSVSVRVDLGGRRIIQKKKKTLVNNYHLMVYKSQR